MQIGINTSQHITEQTDIGGVIFQKRLDIKHDLNVLDPICKIIVMDDRAPRRRRLFSIRESPGLRADVLSLEKRDLLQLLLRRWLLLIAFQLCRLSDEFLLLRLRKSSKILFQTFCLPFFHLRRQSGLRFDRHKRTMCVIQKIFLDQRLKIPVFHFPPQFLERFICLKVDKRFFRIVKPAVENLQTIHQPFRIHPKISFAVTEFQRIQSGIQ